MALDDATVENGCIWVIPASHKWGVLPHERDDTLSDKVGYRGPEVGVAVPVKRGQVIAFSSLLLHRSGANATDKPRRAYVIQYCQTDTLNPETGERWGDNLPVTSQGRVLAS
jgi:ectoine hydroxylase-related dioxygenase (phytanoyl-CoA dioxygenase family)